ncbi:hypothetical protein NMY22_g14591 [Coprinellus aureogranulatus]|nr:hypothetical protein NMY22_g14591 [Coprinellus aureogranulatus]
MSNHFPGLQGRSLGRRIKNSLRSILCCCSDTAYFQLPGTAGSTSTAPQDGAEGPDFTFQVASRPHTDLQDTTTNPEAPVNGEASAATHATLSEPCTAKAFKSAPSSTPPNMESAQLCKGVAEASHCTTTRPSTPPQPTVDHNAGDISSAFPANDDKSTPGPSSVGVNSELQSAGAQIGASQGSEMPNPPISCPLAISVDPAPEGAENTSGTIDNSPRHGVHADPSLPVPPLASPHEAFQKQATSANGGPDVSALSEGGGGRYDCVVDGSGITNPNPYRVTYTGITLDLTGMDKDTEPLNLVELYLLDMQTQEEGLRIPLVQESPQRWATSGLIFLAPEANVNGMNCIVKDGIGGDVGFVYLDADELRTTGEHFREVTTDSSIVLSMWLEVVGIPPEPAGQVHEDPIAQLVNTGMMSLNRFQLTGELNDITNAISSLQKASSSIPVGHSDLPVVLNSLGISFKLRFLHTGNLSDAAEAVAAQQRAVDLTPDGDPDKPGWLSNLGNTLTQRYDRTGNVPDLIRAVAAQRRAVELTPIGHADLPSRLSNLGGTIGHLFQRTGQLSDITQAISMQQRAVDLTFDGHPEKLSLLANLGYSLQLRYKRTGDQLDLTKAIAVQEKAIGLTPNGHASLSFQLRNLGNSFQARFQHSGDVLDIANAIEVQQRAVKLTPINHAELPSQLGNLGCAFSNRFERTGDFSDIAEAIATQQRAIELTPDGHAYLPFFLNNLGRSFQLRFQRTGDVAYLAEAISAYQRAVNMTAEGHADLSSRLNSLGNALQLRFDRTGVLSDGDEAISYHQRAIDLTPDGHASLPSWLNNLGNGLQSRFERTGDPSDIVSAITAQQRAVHLTPDGHANLPHLLVNLGRSYLDRFAADSNPEDLHACLFYYRNAATATSGAPLTRLDAAIRCAQLLDKYDPLSAQVIVAFDTVVRLLTLLVGLDLTVRSRYNQLQYSSGIVIKGASAALRLQRPDKALEWLEQGRCLVWSQLNNLRTPLERLQAFDSQLAERLKDISKRLETTASTRQQINPSMDLTAKISVEDEARSHLALARQWDDLLNAVRFIPGFESFLQPATCSSLIPHLPEEGPVIVINIDGDRCDALALLVELEEPLHIPLPDFSLAKAKEYRLALQAQLQSGDIRMREGEVEAGEELSGRAFKRWKVSPSRVGIHEVLEGLWSMVTRPILEALGYSKLDISSGVIPPRIWWCPTGIMSFLPIHAAGSYKGGALESVLDYAVSSYTPTVGAIADRAKNLHAIDKSISGLFLTSQPDALKDSMIPGTTDEVTSIFTKATVNRVRALKVVGDDLDVQDCLQYMKNFSSVHFACHASQNAADPLQSRFLLHKGQLKLENIIRMDLKDADLAFLSACQTSTGEEKLSDEAVHLAAGMLAAGYRRVVATMWAINDRYAPQVADDFYEYLWRDQAGDTEEGFDGSRSAYALHYAVQRLRGRLDNSETSLLTWVPYVHFGY